MKILHSYCLSLCFHGVSENVSPQLYYVLPMGDELLFPLFPMGEELLFPQAKACGKL